MTRIKIARKLGEITLAAVTFSSLNLACKTRQDSKAIVANTEEATSNPALKTWEQHVFNSTGLSAIQPACQPIHKKASTSVSFRGHAILLHGFSACPQQFEELTPLLTQAGYDVYVPLYPGHGVVPKSVTPREDNTDSVPNSVALWESFVNETVNGLAEDLQGGEIVLVGLSHGANIAMRAMQKAPSLFQKAVLIAPKLKTEASQFTGLFSNNISLFNIDNFIAERSFGWKKCEEDAVRLPQGRGGFCYGVQRQAIAMLDFAKEVIKKSPIPTNERTQQRAKVQAILSTDDDGVANDSAMKVFGNMIAGNQSLEACKMPKGIPHSMFSKYDFPYDKPWVDELFEGVLSFLRTDAPFLGSTSQGGECQIAFQPAVESEN